MNKRELSSIIAKDTADFLKKGGRIKQIPRGMTAELPKSKGVKNILFTDNNLNDNSNP